MISRLRASVLVENGPAEDLCCEHGLSVHIRYEALSLLLDFGQSDAFARNANALGIDLADVDLAVLSHAHYDHADGMAAFFDRNDHAPLHLSSACAENCWSNKAGASEPHYIGIHAGYLESYRNRLSGAPIDRVSCIAPGVYLVPHTTAKLERLGAQAGMLLRIGDRFAPDGFVHEMSLVCELDAQRLAVFNSCSHAGLAAITTEVQVAFPAHSIAAYVGGFHLMRSSDEAILEAAEVIRAAKVAQVYTGHCTGERALELLGCALPGRITALHPGMVIELD